jgi:hypothetical protein
MERPHGGVQTLSVFEPLLETPGGNVLHETPLFMRVLENPVVRNNAACDTPKSMGNFGFSTVYLGFFDFRGKIACFHRLF